MRHSSLVRRTLAATLLSVLAACASVEPQRPGGPYVRSGPFPAPESLRAPVEFWKNVYSTWGLGQYALHDERYLDLVYEVVDIPGGGREGLTAEDKSVLRAHRDGLEAQLRELERKQLASETLNADEKRLRAKIVASSAGEAGVIGAADRLRAQRGIRERFARGMEIGARYDGRFRQIFREAGVPEDLAYLPHVESSFQASARSSVGAAGIFQFMPGTAKNYMVVHPATDERLDPLVAAQGAARYLADAYSRLGDWGLAITSYNHGVGGLAKARAQVGPDIGNVVWSYSGPAFGFASRNFYAQFLAARELAGRTVVTPARGVTVPNERIVLDHPTSAPHLASYYGLPVEQLSMLNPGWSPAALNGRAMLPAGATVWVPDNTLARLAAAGQSTTPPELIAMADTPRTAAPARKRGVR